MTDYNPIIHLTVYTGIYIITVVEVTVASSVTRNYN